MLILVGTHRRVRQITLNRPEKRNALNMELCRDLAVALSQADEDPAIGAILLNANGPAFCAGMDLRESLDADPAALSELHESIFTVIDRLSKPLIAAVHGPALAGGTGLVSNAQIVVASPDATFGLTEIRIGLWPVLVFRAVALAIGERRATELSLTGRTITARQAFEYGLVTELAENPLEAAASIAASVSEFSPAAVSGGLSYAREIRHTGWKEGGELGLELRRRLIAGDDFQAAAKAFMRKKLE